MKINDSIKNIKGIGPKKYKELTKLNIETIEDLLYFFPRSYEDRRKITLLAEGKDQEYSGFLVKVKKIYKDRFIKEKSLTITRVLIEDEKSIGEAVWFNKPFLKSNLIIGKSYYIYGKVKKTYKGIEIISPDYKPLDNISDIDQGIIPNYKLTTKLYQKEIRRFISLALEETSSKINEYIPEELRIKYRLCHIQFAIENIHFPKNFDSYNIAKERLIFDEFFLLLMSLKLIKEKSINKSKGHIFKMLPEIGRFINKLPYKLTKAQSIVVGEIGKDLSSGKTMNRLVQGDVGSGKTIVAAIALLITSLNGFQGAMMAPTEILANQHYLSLCQLFKAFNINICLLTGNISQVQKKDIIKGIGRGKIDIVIGTHAIIQKGIDFYNLGLVITDEQHRFGVKQRTLLGKKGINPHIMIMTATPIPRTLAHTLYGDLDISLIDELPAGRKPIETFHIKNDLEKRLYGFLKEHVKGGRQVYIVCPLVEESNKIEAESVIELKKYLETNYFTTEKIALIHGKLKANEKDIIMKQFQEGIINVLISTTIIEVGINVPNASIMVIYNAERFGLAQLHQLRGRVGRGPYKSYCFLISDNKNEITQERMKIMTSTNNGFIIAEKDLTLRGPGEFLGVRQHGLPELKIGNIITDIEIISKARKASEDIIQSGRYKTIEKYIEKKFQKEIDSSCLN